MTATTVGIGENAAAAHHEDPDTVGRRWRMGVLLIIVADIAFVVSLIFSYFYLRGLNTEGKWLATGGKTAAIWVGWAIAAGLIVAAVCYRWGLGGLRKADAKRLVTGSGLALMLVLIDGVAQVVQLASFPFKPDSSAYASSVYTLAGANLFHLALTVFIGLGLWNRSRLGKYTVADHWQVDIVGYWYTWIAVAAVGGALTTSFIASPNVIH